MSHASSAVVSSNSFELTIRELSRLAEKFPSRRLYQQMAECYHQIGEHDEASVMLDLARKAPDQARENHGES